MYVKCTVMLARTKIQQFYRNKTAVLATIAIKDCYSYSDKENIQ